jgi:hypothetical protein
VIIGIYSNKLSYVASFLAVSRRIGFFCYAKYQKVAYLSPHLPQAIQNLYERGTSRYILPIARTNEEHEVQEVHLDRKQVSIESK